MTEVAKLQNRAMLVRVRIHRSHNRRVDPKATQRVASEFAVPIKTGTYYKKFLPDSAFDEVDSAEYQIRRMLERRTVKWGDGHYMLPAHDYFDFVNEMRQLRDNFDTAADNLADNLVAYREAARAAQKDLFDARIYPKKEAFRSLFSVDVAFLPVPDSGHFAIDLGNEALDEMRASCDAELARRQEESAAAALSQLGKMVNRLQEALSDHTKIVRSSLVTSIVAYCDVLPKLCLSDEANAIAQRAKAACDRPIDQMRNEPEIRDAIAFELSTLVRRINKTEAKAPVELKEAA